MIQLMPGRRSRSIYIHFDPNSKPQALLYKNNNTLNQYAVNIDLAIFIAATEKQSIIMYNSYTFMCVIEDALKLLLLIKSNRIAMQSFSMNNSVVDGSHNTPYYVYIRLYADKLDLLNLVKRSNISIRVKSNISNWYISIDDAIQQVQDTQAQSEALRDKQLWLGYDDWTNNHSNISEENSGDD